MPVTLMTSVAGILLGCTSAAAIGCIFLISRPYRRANNRIAIRLAQIFALISICGGLILIQILERHWCIRWHSSPYYAAIWSYLTGCIPSTFFILKADVRWQRSIESSEQPS